MSQPIDMGPLVTMAKGIVDSVNAEYDLKLTPAGKATMALGFLADWLSKHMNRPQAPIQEIKIHWPTSPGGG